MRYDHEIRLVFVIHYNKVHCKLHEIGKMPEIW